MKSKSITAKIVYGLALFGALGLGSSAAGLLLIWSSWYAPVNNCATAAMNGPCSPFVYLASEPFPSAIIVLGVLFVVTEFVREPQKTRLALIILVLALLGFVAPMLYALVPQSTPPPAAP